MLYYQRIAKRRNNNSLLTYNHYQWENFFSSIILESYQNKNNKRIEDIIKNIFVGYPYELAYKFIFSFYPYNDILK